MITKQEVIQNIESEIKYYESKIDEYQSKIDILKDKLKPCRVSLGVFKSPTLQKTILLLLGKKPHSQQDIIDKLGLANSTIVEAFQSLQQKQLIKFIKNDHSNRIGRPSKIFGLTRKGRTTFNSCEKHINQRVDQ